MLDFKSKENYYTNDFIPIIPKEPISHTLGFDKSFTEFLISKFNQYFLNQPKTTPKRRNSGITLTHEGIIPHTKDDYITTSFLTKDTVTAPISIIDNYRDVDEDYYLSQSNESYSTMSSSFESDYSYRHRASISSITLSEILCDHYINRHQSEDENNLSNELPLETYKLFEASQRHIQNNYQSKEDSFHDKHWFIWNTLQEEKEWIQVVDEEKEVIITEIPMIEKTRRSRQNSAHLRMIVAEVNMMRANKIVCPLRSRGSLPPRKDIFNSNVPSPLRNSF